MGIAGAPYGMLVNIVWRTSVSTRKSVEKFGRLAPAGARILITVVFRRVPSRLCVLYYWFYESMFGTDIQRTK